MMLQAERLLTRFPLTAIVVVLDQDQSGLTRQVHAQGGVLKVTVFGTPLGTEPLSGKPHFNNQYARCGATFLSCLKTLLRPPRLTRRLAGRQYTYALCSMSEAEDNQWLTKRCRLCLSLTCLGGSPMITTPTGYY